MPFKASRYPHEDSIPMIRVVGAILILIIIALAAPVSNARADFVAGVAAFRNNDYETAYKEWRPLAERGNAAAQHNLGTLYNYGLGLPKDLVQALKWYRRAAHGGNANAQTKLGIFLAQGLSVDQNYGQAAKWFREAAEQLHPEAQFNLGVLYATGSGVDKDRVQALMWLSLAYEAGIEQAARPRGLLIEEMSSEDVEEAALLAEIIKPAVRSTAETPAAEAVEPAKPVTSAIVVQLASYASEQAAADGWLKLRRVHGDLLGALDYSVATIDLADQGVFYRLLTGPFESPAMAKSLCAELKARNIYCATAFR